MKEGNILKNAKNIFNEIQNGIKNDQKQFSYITTLEIIDEVKQLIQNDYEFYTGEKTKQDWFKFEVVLYFCHLYKFIIKCK